MRVSDRTVQPIAVVAAAAVFLAAAWTPMPPRPAVAEAPSPALPEMVDRETVDAIDRGLEYLVRTQRRDGSWLSGGGYGMYPAVMTSLSGLALMSNGSTPNSGRYSRNVSKAMHYILRVAETHEDGLIVGPGAESRSMYGHGFSMLFLAQCYGAETNQENAERIRRVLEEAVALTAESQSDLGAANDHAGGWIYTPDGRGDEGSVTVTQLQALRACRNAGIKVPGSTIDRAVAYLRYCQQPDGGICYSARSRGSSRPAISAAAIACFYSAGVYDRQAGGAGEEAEMVEQLVRYCLQHAMPGDSSGGHYFYTQFYMSQGMYVRGGEDWKDYYPNIRRKLLGMQFRDGSWNGDSVGNTYGTALATLILQLPYGYLPILER